MGIQKIVKDVVVLIIPAINPIKRTRYYIDDIDVVVPGKDLTVIPASNIESITIDRVYDRLLPILNILVSVNVDTYTLIMNNYDKIIFNINIYTSDTQSEQDDDGEYFYFKTANIRSQFRPIIENVNPMMSKDIAKGTVPEDANVPKGEDYIPLNLYLFNEEHLRKYRRLLNVVLQDTNITSVLYYVLNYFDMKNVLMSKPDNTKKYDQILIPPYNFLGIINYLQKVYGIYNNGYILFQDYDTLYLVDKKAECNTYREKEYKRIHFNIVDSSNPDAVMMTGFSEDKDTQTCIINVPGSISIANKSVNEKDKRFNEMIIVDSKQKTITTKDINLKGYGEYKTPKIFHNNYSNPYIENSIKNEMEEGNNIFTFSIDDINMSLLTVNKEYVINFENLELNSRYSGKCRLDRVLTSFTKNVDHFLSRTIIEMKKI